MSVFDGLTQEQLRAALGSAQLALIDLQTGKAASSLSYTQGDGAKAISKRVTSVAECTVLIQQLRRALGLPGASRRPMRMTYL